MVDLYSTWWRFLDHLPPRSGLRVCKALRSADLITLSPHGVLLICKALIGAYLYFLASWWHYGRSCLHILIDSSMHWYCGVFIPVKIISFLYILLASLMHWSSGVFIPVKIRIRVGVYILINIGSSTPLFSLQWNYTSIFNPAGIGCHHPQFWYYGWSSLSLCYG